MDWFQDVFEFHKSLGHPIGDRPDMEVDPDVRTTAINLILEEVHELVVAVLKNDLVETADGLVDLIYVVIGAAIAFGIDLRPLWEEVHKANMSKAGGPKRQDGKQLKPENWTPPQLSVLLDKQESLLENSRHG